jgi:Tfp pilus assembly protein PilF
MRSAAQPVSTHHRTSLYIFISALFLLSSCAAAVAQSVGSTRDLSSSGGGSNTIQGRVYFPVEPAGGKRVKVRLSSTDMSNQSTVTDVDGTFRFNGLTAGHYTVTVEGGNEFDQAVEPVSIDREAGAGGRAVQVMVNLKLKGTADAYNKIPKAARDLYTKGTEAAAKNDSKKAAEHFSGAVAAYPEFLQALSELGVQYLKLGQPDKAAESLQAALKLAPNDLGVRLNYGVALLNQKKFTEAETQLREVLTKNSNMPTAHMYLGIALLNQSRDEKTKQFDAVKYEEAQKELESAVGTGKDEVAQAHRYLGGIYWGNKDYKRAADEFETYLKLAPKAPDAEKLRAAIKDLRSKG